MGSLRLDRRQDALAGGGRFACACHVISFFSRLAEASIPSGFHAVREHRHDDTPIGFLHNVRIAYPRDQSFHNVLIRQK